jgi:hypothetical protein
MENQLISIVASMVVVPFVTFAKDKWGLTSLGSFLFSLVLALLAGLVVVVMEGAFKFDTSASFLQTVTQIWVYAQVVYNTANTALKTATDGRKAL